MASALIGCCGASLWLTCTTRGGAFIHPDTTHYTRIRPVLRMLQCPGLQDRHRTCQRSLVQTSTPMSDQTKLIRPTKVSDTAAQSSPGSTGTQEQKRKVLVGQKAHGFLVVYSTRHTPLLPMVGRRHAIRLLLGRIPIERSWVKKTDFVLLLSIRDGQA